VRDWLLGLSRGDRKAIGCDIKTAQYGWPIGMPLIRKLEPGLWEVRSAIERGIARVIFTVEDDVMVLLHGFVKKKSVKIPSADLQVARDRRSKLRGAQ
jgi:phage-related protein